MVSSFLDNLKNAVEKGDFNSEAAKKINEIHELAGTKLSAGATEADLEKLKEKLEKHYQEASSVDTDSEEVKEFRETKKPIEEDVLELNSAYEKKMEEIKLLDAVNQQLATLVEIEDMVQLSLGDMMTFVVELESKFEKEFEDEKSIYGDLYLKIEQIKSKYIPIINN